jgi:hypothetical protein
MLLAPPLLKEMIVTRILGWTPGERILSLGGAF